MTDPSSEDQSAVDATKAPLLDHLIELRKRLIWSLIAFGICAIGCFLGAKYIYAFLTIPLSHAMEGMSNRHLISTGVTEIFFTYMKLGMFGGVCLGFPIIVSQIWMFVAPGLYKHEKKVFARFLLLSPVLFIVGAAFVFLILLPYALPFFLGYQSPGSENTLPIQVEARVSEYLDFVMTLILAFGLTFQLPILMALLGQVGIVQSKQLRDFRRYAIVGIFGVAAIFTPPDPISMLSLAMPLTVLYEAGVIWVKFIEKNRLSADAARAAASK